MTSAIGTYATTALVKQRLFATAAIAAADTTDDTLIGTIVDQTNAFLEGPAGFGRVVAPISSATYLLDGDGSRYLYFPKGIRAITDLQIGDYTADTRDVLVSTDYWLRPLTQDRLPGWPAFWIVLGDQLTGFHRSFHAGFETVSLTCTAGWAAIPDDVTDVAVTTAVRAWHARQNGQVDIVGTDDTGAPLVSRYVAPHHWSIIKGYRAKSPAVITGKTTYPYAHGLRW